MAFVPSDGDNPPGQNSFGDTKYGFQPSDHAGWLKLDGRLLSTLTASQQFQASQLGINSNLPNAFGRVVIGADAVSIFPPKSTGGSANIQRSELPNVTLTGTVDQRNTAHTHDGSSLTTGTESAGHTHSGTSLSAASAGSEHQHSYNAPSSVTSFQAGSSTSVYTQGLGATLNTPIGGAHGHSITGSTGDRSATHTHTVTGSTGAMSANASHDHAFTTPSLNGGVVQTAHYQPYIALYMFIFLGA